jgi:hypothetical protein
MAQAVQGVTMVMRFLRVVLLALTALSFAGLAAAQGEPTINQIYAAARSGQIDKAREMTQQVLRDHPNSAKAHFVMAELDASQGKLASAREALATAESLAPGLPFARPEAVQALRTRLGSGAVARSPAAAAAPAALPVREAPRAPSFPWGTVLLAVAAVAVVALFIRSRNASRSAARPGNPAGAYGPAAGATAWGRQQPRYGEQQPYGPQPGYGAPQGYGPQPAQPGMGGHIMGGLATGLAVGAGAVAAQQIGRHIFGGQEQQGLGSVADPHSTAASSPLAGDAGLGAIGGASAGGGLFQDFGIADAGSWDDGGGSFDVGGGDDGGGWDNS